MSIFDSLPRRTRAETAALARERLHALVSSSAGVASTDEPDAHPVVDDDSGLTDRTQRWRISPIALLGLVTVLVLAVVAAALFAWNGRARDVGADLAPPQVPHVATSVSTDSTSAGATGSVVVDVAGRVRRPGLVTLPGGSRVADALRAAGGALPGTDLTSINLARKLIDGEQIVVGTPAAPSAVGGNATPGPTNPLDLNTASANELDQLPGVGPVLAQRIVDWRTAHGGFTAVSQLRQVTGIGDSKYADLQPLVRV